MKQGKLFDHPKFIEEEVELHWDRNAKKWLVEALSSRALTGHNDCGKA